MDSFDKEWNKDTNVRFDDDWFADMAIFNVDRTSVVDSNFVKN